MLLWEGGGHGASGELPLIETRGQRGLLGTTELLPCFTQDGNSPVLTQMGPTEKFLFATSGSSLSSTFS